MAFTSDKGRQGAAGVSTGYEITNSARFEDGDTAYLSRTPGSAGNQKTWTWSGWVKKSKNGNNCVFSAGSNASNDLDIIAIWDNIDVYSYDAAYAYRLVSTRLLRDPSAWYHLMVVLDTPQATESDRLKIYLNGIRVTDFTTETYPSQNSDSYNTNNTTPQYIGRKINEHYLDGYLADVYFIDGTAELPSAFGETDETYGHWKAIEYTGTYGTNGFYLDFKDSGSLGNDANGSNNWTVNGLNANDQMLDSPTNNFATLNSLDRSAATFKEGNLEASVPAVNESVTSSYFMESGKYYAEFLCTTVASFSCIGISNSLYVAYANSPGNDTASNSTAYNSNDGYLRKAASSGTAYGSSYTTGDIISVAIDKDNDKYWFGKNGTWQNSGDPTNSSDTNSADSNADSISITGTGITISLGNSSSTATAEWNANFGADSSFANNKTSGSANAADGKGYGDFYYTPPTGFNALCTQNLPEPVVVPSENFNTVLYTGDGTSTRSITGVGFQPDLVWSKPRSNGGSHMLTDAVRGAGLTYLHSNTTEAENSNGSTYGYLDSFDTDGFGVTYGTNGNWTNIDGWTYVAWNWKADNTSGSSNTDGTITSTVSANVDAGFSIVSYTSASSGSYTVGHGLSEVPELIINKARGATSAWWAFMTLLDGSLDYVDLQRTLAKADDSTGLALPTSTVFSMVDNYTPGSTTTIAYCFHSVEGYSKVGSYTGNGSTDGTFVYTGFRPAYVMIKNTTTAATDWYIYDAARDSYNVIGERLLANGSNTGFTATYLDFTANGFKWRTSDFGRNESGSTFIYLAFAEHPFKYTNAR